MQRRPSRCAWLSCSGSRTCTPHLSRLARGCARLTPYRVHLLTGTQSKELEAILAAIQLRNEALEYSKMTSLASSLQTPSALPHSELDRLGNRTKQSVQDEWKEINQQISAIVNVGFSMFAVGTGVWWVSAGSHYTPVSSPYRCLVPSRIASLVPSRVSSSPQSQHPNSRTD